MNRRAIGLAAMSIGVTAGLRTFTPLAAVSWAASGGALRLKGTPFAFLGSGTARWILTTAAMAELVVDQLPSTPSRKTPPQFAARIVSGAVSGASVAAAARAIRLGHVAGAAGAVVGTVGGHLFRSRSARAFRRDRPAALLEDVLAISGAVLAARGFV